MNKLQHLSITFERVMIFVPSGLPGEPLRGFLGRLGSLSGRLGPSGGHLRPSWVHLGPSRRRLGGHLGPSWSRLERKNPLQPPPGIPPGSSRDPGGTGRSARGSSFGKEPKPKPRGSSTPGTPVMNQQGAADLVAFGPCRHRAWVVG